VSGLCESYGIVVVASFVDVTRRYKEFYGGYGKGVCKFRIVPKFTRLNYLTIAFSMV